MLNIKHDVCCTLSQLIDALDAKQRIIIYNSDMQAWKDCEVYNLYDDEEVKSKSRYLEVRLFLISSATVQVVVEEA